MEATLAIGALVSSIAGGAFLLAALRVRERDVDTEASDAVQLYSIWWLSLALYALAGASIDLGAALALGDPTLYVGLRYLQLMSFCIGLWGLVYYVAYLITGRRDWRTPLAIVYGGYYALLLFLLTLGRPAGVRVHAWATRDVYAQPALDPWSSTLLLVLPPLVASITYLTLMRFVADRMQRVRVVLVTFGTIAWLLGILLVHGVPDMAWPALPPLLALASAWSVTWAYRPPAWLRRRLEGPHARGAGP